MISMNPSHCAYPMDAAMILRFPYKCLTINPIDFQTCRHLSSLPNNNYTQKLYKTTKSDNCDSDMVFDFTYSKMFPRQKKHISAGIVNLN